MSKENQNSINEDRRKLLSLAGAASAGALLSPLISKAAPSTIIEAGSNVDTASYIIFKDGNTIYAKNGTTGKIEFQGTDAATVIQGTINNLTSGGKIFIKNGTYDISSTIFYKKNEISIEGEGMGSVLKLADNANVDVLSAGRRNNRRIIIKNLNIDGNWKDAQQNVKNTSGRGFVFTGYYSMIDNLYISNCAGNGFDAEVPVGANESMVDNYISNIRTTKCGGTGFTWGTQSGGRGSDNYIHNLTSWYNSASGIDIKEGAANITIDMLHAYSNSENGVFIRESLARISNSESESNGKHGFWIYRHGAWDSALTACAAYDNSKSSSGLYHGFYIDGDGTWTTGQCALIGCVSYGAAWGVKQDYQTALARNTVIGGVFSGNQLGAINVSSTLKAYGINNPLYENKGVFTASGDGAQAQFTISHSLASAPTTVELSAKSKDATGEKFWTADATNVTVNFITPPPIGTNNIILSWKAEV